MNAKVKLALASYARAFVVAALTAYSVGARDLESILIAGLVAVAGPAIRAINPKDPAFGLVAEVVEAEIKKLPKKKAIKKK